nr:winged helix-turn-helix domain-containing protein [Clostridium tepidiprofundi]
MFWILNKSDGNNSLLDIANHSGLSFREIKNTADLLVKEKLLKEI